MPTKIERIKLEALLRETLGLASAGNDPVVINEPPVVPVQPKPSVSGAEVGKLKSVPAFETNPTMRKLGKLLSKLSEDQQSSVYKKLRKSMKKVREQANEEQQLARIIEAMINEIDDEPEWMKSVDGPSAEDLEAIDMGDEGAGEYSEEEPDEEEVVQAFQRRAKLTPEELATVDLMDPELRVGRDALTIGEIIEAIALQLGVGRSAVTNVLYDYMKKVGDHAQVRKQPSKRTKIPSRLDPEVYGTAEAVEKEIYDAYKDLVGQLNPDAKALPEYERFANAANLRPAREVYRQFAKLIFRDYYGGDIKSSADLVSQWHNLGTGREHGDGKPHSEENSLHMFIVRDIKKAIDGYEAEDLGKMLRAANKKADKELAKRK
tara:strand:+ start:177 stop:1307 length:1131 start_codon:yes stop_codon:yes gene_type:complete